MKKPSWALVFLLGLTVGCTGPAAAPAPPQSVVVLPVRAETVTAEPVWSGQITPAETVKLSFRVAGVVEAIGVRAGETVAAGQTLARLETGDYELQVRAAAAAWQAAQAQAETILPAGLTQARAQLELTRANYERAAELFAAGALAAAGLDEITAKKTADEAAFAQATEALVIGRAEADRARAAWDLALSNLAGAEIKSPWDGVVLQVIAAAGESAAAGYPVLVLGRNGEMWAEISLTDAEASGLTTGLPAAVYVYGPEDTWTGSLDEIGALADSLTRGFTGRVRLDNADGRLRAGMIARVTLTLPGRERILAPLSSVLPLAEGESVFLYDAATGTARRRSVETGEIVGARVEVLSGLAAGDDLIVEGQGKLRDGDRVTPQ
ncbi:MAG: efflux RND transporter periplasmic adaptor subunit [Gracilibacteraceae bacterium]|jgi:RND family efflux transporter MFP subunit|nr:efflux RND transporter periplasmic adaptor subunit [Gracilibacteraceae bacterium]